MKFKLFLILTLFSLNVLNPLLCQDMGVKTQTQEKNQAEQVKRFLRENKTKILVTLAMLTVGTVGFGIYRYRKGQEQLKLVSDKLYTNIKKTGDFKAFMDAYNKDFLAARNKNVITTSAGDITLTKDQYIKALGIAYATKSLNESIVADKDKMFIAEINQNAAGIFDTLLSKNPKALNEFQSEVQEAPLLDKKNGISIGAWKLAIGKAQLIKFQERLARLDEPLQRAQ